MVLIAISLILLIIVVLFSVWFYYKRTKRLLHRNREEMQHSVDRAFIQIENRLMHGVSELKNSMLGKNIWALVFTYNRKSLAEQTLATLHAHEPALPILVVDNGSTDGTREMLCTLLREGSVQKLLFNTHDDIPQWQKSFSINQALKLLSLEPLDYLVWLDDDLEIQRPFLTDAIALLDALKSERVKVISMTDNDIEEQNHPTLKRLHINLLSGRTEVKIRSSFNGQFNLFSSDFFRELGPPPIGEGIRGYVGEDWYYSRRLQAMDYYAAVFVAATNVGYTNSMRIEVTNKISPV